MNEFDSNPSGVSSDDSTMAMLAHLLGIFTWFIGPLIVWLINKDKPEKAFVTDQAKEALNFQITVTLAFIVCTVLMVVIVGALLMPLLVIADLVLCILAAIKAKEGVNYRYPFALRLIN